VNENENSADDVIYHGYHHGSAGAGVVAIETEQGQQLGLLRHVIWHSPTGLSWGYQGSGPADLARSLLIAALATTPAAPPAPARPKSSTTATYTANGPTTPTVPRPMTPGWSTAARHALTVFLGLGGQALRSAVDRRGHVGEHVIGQPEAVGHGAHLVDFVRIGSGHDQVEVDRQPGLTSGGQAALELGERPSPAVSPS
jgi:hypothetical protein